MQSVAVSVNDLLGLRHFLFAGGIVGSELIGAVGPFSQEKALACLDLQSVDRVRRENDAERFANLTNSQFDHTRNRESNFSNAKQGKVTKIVAVSAATRLQQKADFDPKSPVSERV